MAKELDINAVIGHVLRLGVMLSSAIILIGTSLLFLEGQTGYGPLGSAEQLYSESGRTLIGLVPLVQGVASVKPFAIMELGLIILLATPITRVLISVFLFLNEKRYNFVAITLSVLAILLFSVFVVGPILSV